MILDSHNIHGMIFSVGDVCLLELPDLSARRFEVCSVQSIEKKRKRRSTYGSSISKSDDRGKRNRTRSCCSRISSDNNLVRLAAVVIME